MTAARIAALSAALWAATLPAAETNALRALAGARARVVWLQDTSAKAADVAATGDKLRIAGLDTDDGKGERLIVAAVGRYGKPLLTPSGQQVVFSSRDPDVVWTVNWDGTGLREVTRGYALDTWRDQTSGREWVYFGQGVAKGKGKTLERVQRIPLDATAPAELVWDQAPLTPDFRVSRDGSRAGGLFPWPHSGVARLPNLGWEEYQRGCWPCLAPDNSYLLWTFDGAHRNVTLQWSANDPGRVVGVNGAPEIRGFEVYHPRWSNHPRFLVVTGPYAAGGGKPGANRIRAGGAGVEIFAGRFDPRFEKVEAWARVTRNDLADFFPDLWIENGETASVADTLPPPAHAAAAATAGTAVARWPGTRDSLVLLWENAKDVNPLTDAAGKPVLRELVLHGEARYGRFFDLELDGGWAQAEDASARLLTACRDSNALTVEALVTPMASSTGAPARILSFAPVGGGAPHFAWEQDGDTLALLLRTGETGAVSRTAPLPLESGKPQHVLVSYADGRLDAFLDGREAITRRDVRGGFGAWTDGRLIVGDDAGRWAGRLEGLAIWARATDAEEAQRRFRLARERVAGRPPVAAAVAEATLEDMPKIPDPEDLLPYRRCLLNATYRVDRVVAGTLDAKRVVAAQWCILDGKRLAHALRIGQRYRLELEPLAAHPQLKSERLAANNDDPDLPLYYDRRPIGRLVPLSP